MAKPGWSVSDAPDLSGRTAVVTGANSGIGLPTAGYLAALGAHVVLACRNPGSAAAARDEILTRTPAASAQLVQIDLGDLASVRRAADELRNRHRAIDILVNNAGVMRARRELTVDGFEMDFGTNFLGHFAFTGLLLDRLRAARGARVVTVCSNLSRVGTIDFDDVTLESGYHPATAYARSKMALAVYGIQLQRRLSRLDGDAPSSLLAHPGATHTGVMRDQRALRWLFTTPSLRRLRRTFIMDPPEGALPSLRAATDPAALGGQYYGPNGFLQFSGTPVLVPLPRQTTDLALAQQLWEFAEKSTGVVYDLPGEPVR
ncbi:oxidoreductase [Gordonia sp. NPDC003425]